MWLRNPNFKAEQFRLDGVLCRLTEIIRHSCGPYKPDMPDQPEGHLA